MADYSKHRGKKNKNVKVLSNGIQIREQKGLIDYGLIFAVILLILFGLLMLYSATSYYAYETQNGDSFFFVRKQCRNIVVGCVLGTMIIAFNYYRLRFLYKLAYILSFFLICMVKTPLGITKNGATRWVNLYFIQVQPAEVLKIAMILMLALVITEQGERMRKPEVIIKVATYYVIFPAIFLGVMTSNLSSAAVIALIGLLIIFTFSKNWRFFFQVAGIGICVLALVIAFHSITDRGGSGFRAKRITVWLNPEADAQGTGYQILQGKYAIGSGGFLGKGIGNGIQKVSIPEVYNDYIFSAIAEELGFVGIVLLAFLYLYILYRMLAIAVNSPTLLGSIITWGVILHIGLHAYLNMGINSGLIPNTGVTLPLISYGGSSMVLTMVEFALVFSVSLSIKQKEFLRETTVVREY